MSHAWAAADIAAEELQGKVGADGEHCRSTDMHHGQIGGQWWLVWRKSRLEATITASQCGFEHASSSSNVGENRWANLLKQMDGVVVVEMGARRGPTTRQQDAVIGRRELRRVRPS